MAAAPELIRYLRACHRSDSRQGSVWNLFGKSVEHHRGLERDVLLCGELDRMPLPAEDVGEAARAAALYQREKSLVYYAFPVIGRAAARAPYQGVLCAPLLIYPAQLTESEDGLSGMLSLRIETDAQRLNVAGVEALLGQTEGADSPVEQIWERLPEAPLRPDRLHDLCALLGELLPGLDSVEMLRFPELTGEAQLRAAFGAARRGGATRCLAACGLALLPNSVETRGIHFELGALATADEHSAPVRALLGAGPEPEAARPGSPASRAPAVLSAAQERALEAAARYPLTLVIGPPGTGKSYTAAAIALDHLGRGESVLIASRSEQALNVVEQKLGALLGRPSTVLRAGRRSYLRELKRFLEDLLHGRLPGDDETTASRPLRRRLARLERRLARREERLSHSASLEERWGEIDPEALGAWSGLWARLVRGAIRARLRALPDPWALLRGYERELDERSRLASQLLRRTVRERLDWALTHHREQLQRFLKALRARHSSRQEQILSTIDMAVLLETFPLWMTSFQDAHRAVPHEAALFDLVIVDEATQCDMASGLPVLQRARRVVVMGDPRQLRHVSFLARRRQGTLAETHGLDSAQLESFDYRSKSLLDLASERVVSRDQAISLDEHFRSAPQLIAFSNREYYAGALRIMTRRPQTVRRGGLELRTVPGRRNESGVNREEAKALMDELARRIESEASLPGELSHTVGVLSPFRDQVEHLRTQIGARLSLAALEKHALLVGTPYSFQGEERDTMLLSLALDDSAPHGAFRYLERSDVFNVAITRARAHQVVFTSLTPRRLKSGGRLRRYLEEAAGDPMASQSSSAFAADPFAGEVSEALAACGFRVWHGYVVAGLAVDMLVEREGASLGIDLIGQPGPFAGAFDLERYRMLRRAGLPVFPLPMSVWRDDRQRCLAALERSVPRRPVSSPFSSPGSVQEL